MKKIIKLTESDLQRIVNRVIRESMISELGGMDDGHPFSGNLNFNDLSSDDRKKVNKYYRFDDEEVDDSFSELDNDEDEDEDEGFPEWEKLKKYMDDRDKKQIDDRNEKMDNLMRQIKKDNSERPFNRD
jgi:hypothetical protein